ncbi:MAG TPA: HD domain-containing protein [Anaerolineales bacterium]|nr:HD domain-containing protein [Anaerolineales bacterium]
MTVFRQAAYRLRQFRWAVGARLSEREQAAVCQLLPPSLHPLFFQLAPSEQAHAWRVWQAVLAQGQNAPDLQIAALLHDVGKIRYRLHLWERVWIVLGRALGAKQVQRWGQAHLAEAKFWQMAFVVAQQHPQWGGELVQGQVSAACAWLVTHHADPHVSSDAPSLWREWLTYLQVADNRN